jgi:hypothetical protein
MQRKKSIKPQLKLVDASGKLFFQNSEELKANSLESILIDQKLSPKVVANETPNLLYFITESKRRKR